VTRRLLAREWVDKGKAMLLQGAEWNPDNPWIYRDLGNLCRERQGNLCEAAEYYRRASLTPAAPEYLHRIYGYLLAQCGQHDEEAMRVLREIYDRGLESLRRDHELTWKPSLIVELRKLEERLQVPPDQRIPERFDSELFAIATPWLPERSLPIYEHLLERERAAAASSDPALPSIIAQLRARLERK
jgi:tetratricopeptide (TPR) repeat protein